MTINRQPKGVPSGGQFSAGAHIESGVSLAGHEAADQPSLTLRELEWAESLHGSHDADSSQNYYPVMQQVFAAAHRYVETTACGQEELRRQKQAEKISKTADKLADITGIPSREIVDFHDDIAGHEPNSRQWNETLQAWSQDVWNEPRGTVSFIDYSMREAAAVETTSPGEERRALMAERRRLDARIAAMDLNDAAAGIRRVLPAAELVEAQVTNEEYDGQVHMKILAADGSKLWAGDPEDEMTGVLDLVEWTPERPAGAPITKCRTGQPNQYSLEKMAEITADALQ